MCNGVKNIYRYLIMFGLSKYKDIFGKPNEGVHKYRFFTIAILDVVATILLGLLISYIFKLNLAYTLGFVFLFGIFIHRMLFCANNR
jgi:hypothetical protein